MGSQMKRVCGGLLLAIAASAAAARPLDAQEVEQFVIGKDAARSAKTRDEISLDTARRVADDCLRQAAERKTGVAVSILDPAGHVVYAARSDGQTPVAVAPRNLALAVEVGRLQRLVKGYGDTHERGERNFTVLMALADDLVAREDGAATLARLHDAALADEEGSALARELATATLRLI